MTSKARSRISTRNCNRAVIGACIMALFAWFALVLPPSARAQSTAAVNGTVTDSSGAVVQNAKIVINHLATGVTETAMTNNVGVYFIQNLHPGRYRLRVGKPGFETQSQTFTLSVTQTATSK